MPDTKVRGAALVGRTASRPSTAAAPVDSRMVFMLKLQISWPAPLGGGRGRGQRPRVCLAALFQRQRSGRCAVRHVSGDTVVLVGEDAAAPGDEATVVGHHG